MRLLVSVILSLLLTNARSQSALLNKEWYGIGPEGLLKFTFTEKTIGFERQTYSFTATGKKNLQTIIGQYKKNELICFVQQDSIGGDQVYRTTVIKEPVEGGSLEVIMNCAADDFSDSTKIKEAFYSCDASKFMTMRFYDRKAIEEFSKLKTVSSMAETDFKKINGLYHYYLLWW